MQFDLLFTADDDPLKFRPKPDNLVNRVSLNGDIDFRVCMIIYFVPNLIDLKMSIMYMH